MANVWAARPKCVLVLTYLLHTSTSHMYTSMYAWKLERDNWKNGETLICNGMMQIVLRVAACCHHPSNQLKSPLLVASPLLDYGLMKLFGS